MDHPIEVIARGLLLREAYALLCQNTRHGYWYLPGGHVEFGEAAAVALAREFREECGLEVTAQECVLVSEAAFKAKREHHEINLVFRVTEAGEADAEVASQEEGVSFGWFELAELADIDVRPPAIKAWLLAGGRLDTEAATCAFVSEIRPA
jgi:8-oxo-dGTP diphosphatase